MELVGEVNVEVGTAVTLPLDKLHSFLGGTRRMTVVVGAAQKEVE